MAMQYSLANFPVFTLNAPVPKFRRYIHHADTQREVSQLTPNGLRIWLCQRQEGAHQLLQEGELAHFTIMESMFNIKVEEFLLQASDRKYGKLKGREGFFSDIDERAIWYGDNPDGQRKQGNQWHCGELLANGNRVACGIMFDRPYNSTLAKKGCTETFVMEQPVVRGTLYVVWKGGPHPPNLKGIRSLDRTDLLSHADSRVDWSLIPQSCILPEYPVKFIVPPYRDPALGYKPVEELWHPFFRGGLLAPFKAPKVPMHPPPTNVPMPKFQSGELANVPEAIQPCLKRTNLEKDGDEEIVVADPLLKRESMVAIDLLKNMKRDEDSGKNDIAGPSAKRLSFVAISVLALLGPEPDDLPPCGPRQTAIVSNKRRRADCDSVEYSETRILSPPTLIRLPPPPPWRPLEHEASDAAASSRQVFGNIPAPPRAVNMEEFIAAPFAGLFNAEPPWQRNKRELEERKERARQRQGQKREDRF